MYRWLLCFRYLRTRYIALASIISVTLGVATLIVVNSVMAGFSAEMHERLHGLASDILIECHLAQGMADPELHIEQIMEVVGDDVAGHSASVHVPAMKRYCREHLYDLKRNQSYGHWHYSYLYYAQVVYREGDDLWRPFRDNLYARILGEQARNGPWTGNIGPIYVSSLNLIMLQLENDYLPIYQR